MRRRIQHTYKLQVIVSPELKARLQARARREQRSVSQVVAGMLERLLEPAQQEE